MNIDGREIGPLHHVYLQAELGTAHMGELPRAFELIDAVKAAGFDAAKFIITDPNEVDAPESDPFTYETATGTRTRPIQELNREITFPVESWRRIRDYCKKADITFYATVDHLSAVVLAETLEVPAYKICAWDIAYHDLFTAVARTGKPVLVDVGTTTPGELKEAARLLGSSPRVWLHSPHHQGRDDWNLSRINGPLGNNWGFSSPGRDIWCDVIAVARKAQVIEKRVTLSRWETKGHHHWIALNPKEAAEWVRQIHDIEYALAEDPWSGTTEGWNLRRRYDRTRRMPDGRRLRQGIPSASGTST